MTGCFARCDGALGHGDIVGERDRRVLDDDHFVAILGEDVVDTLPPGAVHEAAVDENDTDLLFCSFSHGISPRFMASPRGPCFLDASGRWRTSTTSSKASDSIPSAMAPYQQTSDSSMSDGNFSPKAAISVASASDPKLPLALRLISAHCGRHQRPR